MVQQFYPLRGNYNNIISDEHAISRAFNYAVNNGAKIISCSWNYADQVVVGAVRKALDNDCIVVFSSGNNNGVIGSPANSDSRIIVVGAIDRHGNRASFSNYGDLLDVVAPGEDVYTLHPGNTTTIVSGTSFAAPQVAGLAAMILSKYPDSSPSDVMYRIFKTASKVNSGKHNYPYSYRHPDSFTTWNNQMGYGLIDFVAALGNDIPYIVTVRIKNSASHRPMSAFHIEFYDTDYHPIQNSDLNNLTCVLETGKEYVFRCNLLPGNYIVSAFCETDGGIEGECEINFTKGGTISYEYTGATNATVHWETPEYIKVDNIMY